MRNATHHLTLAVLLGLAACAADPMSVPSSEDMDAATIESTDDVVFMAEADHVVLL
jgi:hypothetical protein